MALMLLWASQTFIFLIFVDSQEWFGPRWESVGFHVFISLKAILNTIIFIFLRSYRASYRLASTFRAQKFSRLLPFSGFFALFSLVLVESIFLLYLLELLNPLLITAKPCLDPYLRQSLNDKQDE